jgi:kinetochore protein NDC80
MASRPSLRESLGLPIRVDAPAQKKKMSGLPGGGGRTSGVAPPNRRRTQVLAKGSRPSSSAVGPASHKRSSVYGHGGHSQPKKDPRPLSDRSFQISAVKKLIAFLLDKNYGKIYTPKQLQNPSTKEFLHIFNFLVTMIDPYLEVNGMTIVEDVPKTLKLLGYPFTVSKNHMLNVGSPHSWPILLGALAWLVDCCSLPDRTKELMFPSESGFDDGQPTPKEQEMLVEFYMYDVYLQYGHDSPEYQELLQQKAEADRQRLEELKEATVRVVDENEQLERATEELAQSSIPVLMAKKEENDQKLAALEETVERELPQAIARVVEVFNRLMADQSEIEMQTLAAEEKCKELEEMIRNQTMSAKDARELRMSISNAESDLEKHRLLQRDSMARVEELQIQHNRSVGLIDSACATVNNKLHRLSALLPDAASLSPLEYDTSRRADPEVLERLVSQARKLRVRSSLHAILTHPVD